MVIEITKEAFNAIIDNKQNCYVSTTDKELYRETIYRSKGVTLKIIFNHVGSIEQYYIFDINY